MKILGLDVGTKRIGIAKADTSIKIAVPSGVVMVNGQEIAEIARLARIHGTNIFVIGLPRNSQGEETAQSKYVRDFAKRLSSSIPGCRIYFQDESLTSVEAERRLAGKKHQKGDVDAEAAAIILQDCIEHFTNQAKLTPSSVSERQPSQDVEVESSDIKETFESDLSDKLLPDTNGMTEDILLELEAASPDRTTTDVSTLETKQELAENTKQDNSEGKPVKKGKKNVIKFLLGFFLILLVSGAGLVYYYMDSLKPVANSCSDTDTGCHQVKISILTGESLSQISNKLAKHGLIKNPFTFEIYTRLSGSTSKIRAGDYSFAKTMSSEDILNRLTKGTADVNVFRFTILPGETIASIKKKLVELGYIEEGIETAFSTNYAILPDYAELLATKPIDASLEGYLFGETYEFYKNDSVETIIKKALSETAKVVKENNLIELYKNQGLNLHQGLTLASIVQKEAKSPDFPGVAQVFIARFKQGWMLGSDVTTSYAVDLVDPKREIYTDNQKMLEIDSPYNTRKHTGLPPTPISAPSLLAMKSIAYPAETSYLYFLTGDDGKMYYSSTEAEHNQNISSHCQKLCQVKL